MFEKKYMYNERRILIAEHKSFQQRIVLYIHIYLICVMGILNMKRKGNTVFLQKSLFLKTNKRFLRYGCKILDFND